MVIEINLLTMQTTQERLRSYIEDTLRLSIRKFEDSIGVSNGTVGAYLKKEKDALPSDDLYSKIIATYPNIDTIWLLTGVKPKEATSEVNTEAKLKHLADVWKKRYFELLEKATEKGLDID